MDYTKALLVDLPLVPVILVLSFSFILSVVLVLSTSEDISTIPRASCAQAVAVRGGQLLNTLLLSPVYKWRRQYPVSFSAPLSQLGRLYLKIFGYR